MKIYVEMAFDYGKTSFSSGPQECDEINAIQHMVRHGYGKVLTSRAPKAPKAPKAAPKADKPKKKRTTKTK